MHIPVPPAIPHDPSPPTSQGPLLEIEAEMGAKQEALERVDVLRGEMLRALEILYAMQALFEVKPEVSRAEFSRFVHSALKRLPELQALEWIPLVPKSRRKAYEAAARGDGLEGFAFREISPGGRIVRATTREMYFPVFYVEPTPPNSPVLGLDLRADESRRAALERAAESGQPIATSPLQLAQSDSPLLGFLVVLAVREKGVGEVIGFCLAAFRVERVVEEVFAPLLSRGLRLEIHDLTDHERLIFASGDGDSGYFAPWRYELKMPIAGRVWRLHFCPTKSFRPDDADWLRRPAEALQRVNRILENKFLERTAELEKRNRELRDEINRRRKTEDVLRRVGDKLSVLSESEARQWGGLGLIGRSARFGKVLEEVRKVRAFPRTNVLLTGESGTGKELIARAIHFGSPNAAGPFVPVNCSALPAERAEAQLFGEVTSDGVEKKGYFDLADGGTLFLDEVGDMRASLQSKLLRILEDGAVSAVGGMAERRVAVRVVASTNADLPDRVAQGTFRQDLYYRLMHFHIEVPPLRERLEDVPVLARHFVERLALDLKRKPPVIHSGALRRLMSHPYRGNIRELKNTIERAIIYAGENELRAEHIVFSPQAAPGLEPSGREADMDASEFDAPLTDLPYNLAEAEERLIARALRASDGNISKAARLLGVNRTRIYRRRKQKKS